VFNGIPFLIGRICDEQKILSMDQVWYCLPNGKQFFKNEVCHIKEIVGIWVSDDKIQALKMKLELLEIYIHPRSSDRLVKPNGTRLYLEYLENSVMHSSCLKVSLTFCSFLSTFPNFCLSFSIDPLLPSFVLAPLF
jgi:hypothetical protein